MLPFIIALLFIPAIIIALSIKTKYWKYLEGKYKTVSKQEFNKLGRALFMDYGNGGYKNMFGLGLNNTGVILYPAFTNKLTHKNILIPYTEITQYDMDKKRWQFRKYREVRLYLKKNSIILTITESTTETLINELKRHNI